MRGLCYVRDDGPLGDACWQGEKGGQGLRYKRVLVGISVPTPDEPRACALVLGEVYDGEKPPRFTVLAARIAPWADLEGKLVALRRALQPATIVVEPGEEPLAAVRRLLPDLRKAAPHVPCAILPAPSDALGEITRWALDGLIHEDRLTLDAVRSALDPAPAAAARALQGAVAWLLAHKAHYGRRDELRAANKRRARSYSSHFPWPDEPVPVPPILGLRVEGQVLMSADGKHNFGRVGGGPVHPKVREANRRRARSAWVRFRD